MNPKGPLLNDVVARGLLTGPQAQALWQFLQQHQQDQPGFRPAHLLYYLGGLMAIGAMTLFMNLGRERFGGGGLVLISLLYGGAALALTEWLLHHKRQPVPAGLTAVLAVVMVPLAVYGAQRALGLTVIGADLRWQRHEATLTLALRSRLPARWREVLPTDRPSLPGGGRLALVSPSESTLAALPA